MTQNQAIAFLRDITDEHGSTNGCQIIADKLGIGWATVYGWYRRGSIPQWRVDAIERIKPDVIAAMQTGG